jgi:5-formyltetrahydrofolate cyclo-ligase
MTTPGESLVGRKNALRKSVRQIRRTLSPAQRRLAARRAAAHLARACRRWNARCVALYLSLPEELDTAPALRRLAAQGCVLWVPKIRAPGQLRFARWRRGSVLRRNRYGIAEPAAAAVRIPFDLIVLPLVAFDAGGHRLGMGGGYYDRLLVRPRVHRRPLRVGLAFAAQEVPAVPHGAHDARLDAIVTEHGLRRFR